MLGSPGNNTKSVATMQDVLHIRLRPEIQLMWIDYFWPNLGRSGNRWENSDELKALRNL